MISMIAVVPGTLALKVTGFRVPPVALYGSDVHLDCPFSSPSRTKLYSVKWYQNQDEFFRYIFADQTPATAFNLPGIKVDVSQFLFLNSHLIIYVFNGIICTTTKYDEERRRTEQS